MPVRTLMRTMLSAVFFSLVALLMAPVGAHALTTTSGTVSASDPSGVTVSGQRYVIDADTEILDRGGHRVAVKELVPGTPVELEIGDDGNLTVVHATLVR
jgi:hypothetical protein